MLVTVYYLIFRLYFPKAIFKLKLIHLRIKIETYKKVKIVKNIKIN